MSRPVFTPQNCSYLCAFAQVSVTVVRLYMGTHVCVRPHLDHFALVRCPNQMKLMRALLYLFIANTEFKSNTIVT